MVKNTLIYLSIVLLLVSILGVGIYYQKKQDLRYCDMQNIKTDYKGEDICYEAPVYQGAVRPTDDETYFRKTGKTIPLVVKE